MMGPKSVMWAAALVVTMAFPVGAGQATPAKAAQATALVNLNTASEADLVALPGVGPATAKKIIAERPLRSVADLAKAGVPKNTIEKLTALVTVGAAPTAKPTPMSPPPAAPVARATPTAVPPPAPAATARTSAASTIAQQPPVRGMVWVNLSTKVFHREGDRYYGNTKHGKFMEEADAVKGGYREAKMAAKKTRTS